MISSQDKQWLLRNLEDLWTHTHGLSLNKQSRLFTKVIMWGNDSSAQTLINSFLY